MPRGPAPTPTPILKLRGSWRGDARSGEPRPPVESPGDPPAVLKGEARREWRRVTRLLVAMGCIAKIDRALVTAYCEAWGEFVEASRELQTSGLILKTADGYFYPNPLAGIRSRAVERMTRLAAQFGLSPSARTKLTAAPAQDDGAGIPRRKRHA